MISDAFAIGKFCATLYSIRTLSFFLFFSLGNIYLFYFWLLWFFIAAHGLSLVAASSGYSSLWCAGFSMQWLLLLWSTGSRRLGSVVVAHGLSCSAARGIFLDQGSNPCDLHWQEDYSYVSGKAASPSIIQKCREKMHFCLQRALLFSQKKENCRICSHCGLPGGFSLDDVALVSFFLFFFFHY